MSESSSPPETQRLAEIAARLEAATPGPWEWCDYNRDNPERDTWLGVLCGAFEIATPRYEIGHVKYSALPHAENVANATLIANSPADLRLLLDHCAGLESRLLTLEADAERAKIIHRIDMRFYSAVARARDLKDSECWLAVLEALKVRRQDYSANPPSAGQAKIVRSQRPTESSNG